MSLLLGQTRESHHGSMIFDGAVVYDQRAARSDFYERAHVEGSTPSWLANSDNEDTDIFLQPFYMSTALALIA